ncbi:MAG: hypothetical protein IPM57_10180 [Oligoflexia bacterium]|nr:hypothetical protein [Oligoflexia bacterium]
MKHAKLYGKLGLITFILVFITDFIIHGMILKGTYAATASLWRPEADMSHFFPFMLSGQIIVAVFFAIIFTHGYKGKGIKEGVHYGLLMGSLWAGQNLIMYAVLPYPLSLTLSWIFLGYIQTIFIGVLLTKLVKK